METTNSFESIVLKCTATLKPNFCNYNLCTVEHFQPCWLMCTTSIYRNDSSFCSFSPASLASRRCGLLLHISVVPWSMYVSVHICWAHQCAVQKRINRSWAGRLVWARPKDPGPWCGPLSNHFGGSLLAVAGPAGGSVAEWLAYWTRAQ